MTKKLTWEVEKTSLVLKVTDGAKETTWKIRKSTDNEAIRTIFEELQLAMWVPGWKMAEEEPWTGKPMLETARTVDQDELDALRAAYNPVGDISTSAVTEEGSKEALNARVGELKRNARWMDATEDDIYTVEIPDYDSGEV